MARTFLVLFALFLATAPAGAQSLDKERVFRQKRDLVLVKSARRHYDIAEWCWRNDLLSQSTAEILYALEVSDQRHKPSKTALAEMRKFDDDFWTKDRKPPHPLKIKAFHRKIEQARELDLRQHRELAVWAYKTRLPDEARGVYERMLRQSGDAIETDDDGCIQLPRGEVPADLSSEILDGTVAINERLYLRDEFLSHLPELGAVFEAESEAVRVRTPLGEETARDLHALCVELMPRLENHLGGRPTRRVELFVFAEPHGLRGLARQRGDVSAQGVGRSRRPQEPHGARLRGGQVRRRGACACPPRADAPVPSTGSRAACCRSGTRKGWPRPTADRGRSSGTASGSNWAALLAEHRLSSLRTEGALLPLGEFSEHPHRRHLGRGSHAGSQLLRAILGLRALPAIRRE